MTQADWIIENLMDVLQKCGQDLGKEALISLLLGAGSLGALATIG